MGQKPEILKLLAVTLPCPEEKLPEYFYQEEATEVPLSLTSSDRRKEVPSQVFFSAGPFAK